MWLSIWQQFSSNHSATYMVVGKFASPALAQEAANKIRAILQEYKEWWLANKDTWQVELELGRSHLKNVSLAMITRLTSLMVSIFMPGKTDGIPIQLLRLTSSCSSQSHIFIFIMGRSRLMVYCGSSAVMYLLKSLKVGHSQTQSFTRM